MTSFMGYTSADATVMSARVILSPTYEEKMVMGDNQDKATQESWAG